MGALTMRDLGLGAHGEAVDLPNFTSLPTFTTEGGRVVARYVDPSVVERALRSAYVQGQVPVPAPYAFETAMLGPGVNPWAVYQAWQQAEQAGLPWFSETAPEGYGGYGSYAPYLYGMGSNAPQVVRRGGVGCGGRCG